MSTGLHLVVYLPDGVEEAAVVEAAARRGLPVHGLAPYRLSGAGHPGLLLGYAMLDERVLAEGIEILAEALAGLGPAHVAR